MKYQRISATLVALAATAAGVSSGAGELRLDEKYHDGAVVERACVVHGFAEPGQHVSVGAETVGLPMTVPIVYPTPLGWGATSITTSLGSGHCGGTGVADADGRFEVAVLFPAVWPGRTTSSLTVSAGDQRLTLRDLVIVEAEAATE